MSNLAINPQSFSTSTRVLSNPPLDEALERLGLSIVRPLSSRASEQKYEVADADGAHKIAILSGDEHLLNLARVFRDVHAFGRHPGIPHLEKEGLFEVALPGGVYHCLVHSKAEGMPLDDWLEDNGPPSMAIMLRWSSQLVGIIGKLHAAQCLHRDINPSNIIVSNDNEELTLIDYGSIRRMDAEYVSLLGRDRSASRELLTAGTPGYIAPEQAEGLYYALSDYYALGRTLIHVATATHPRDLPWNKGTGVLIWRKQAPHVEPIFAKFIDQLCERNPVHRPQSAKDVLAFLESMPRRSRLERIRRSPVVRGMAVVAGLAIAVAAGVGGRGLYQEYEVRRLTAESRSLQLKGDYASAIELLERAIQITPQDPLLHEELGLACNALNRHDCAETALNNALQLSPEDPILFFNLANVYEAASDYDEAAKWYIRVAHSANPVNIDAANNLARIRILENRVNEAISLIEARLDPEGDPISQATLHKNLGWAFYEKGEYTTALTHLAASIEGNPERPDAFCLSAIIKARLNISHASEAVGCLEHPATLPEVQEWRDEILAEFRSGEAAEAAGFNKRNEKIDP